jgi:hypothetical protein
MGGAGRVAVARAAQPISGLPSACARLRVPCGRGAVQHRVRGPRCDVDAGMRASQARAPRQRAGESIEQPY